MNAPIRALAPAVETLTFRADIATLTGTLFRPAGRPRAAIVLHAATGVPARYYRHFAAWLADRGYACLTYDYRGLGASATRPMRDETATLADWGLRDQPAAQRALEAAVGDVPVWAIGHSIGGMMVPFNEGAARLDRLITVASGPVHLSDHPLGWKARAHLFWNGPGALAAAALGYLPGKILGLGADLPAGVYWQWRRWCTTRGFYLGDIGATLPMPEFRAFTGHLRAVAIADDGMVPPAAVWRLLQTYPEAWKSQAVIRPAGRPIGHIAVFSPENAAHWPAILGQCASRSAQPAKIFSSPTTM
ncbi:alpha/beta hydrolase family protein [Ovoidimarina sediminis]|uniref:alpha/beta hydrolase family protein n=1 Tax=Ovoidimarina sediminis TaxID=3079856 RepID=UPI00290D74A0|nr:alpha/beta fold hydrolase [Rhodophyticola sp. MJ-SS7]MDU8944415.1 alpha/beta fold hydrolase [Rhodophyticola sp. MJ-SS7]